MQKFKKLTTILVNFLNLRSFQLSRRWLLPHDSTDFASLYAFKRGIKENDISRFLCLYIFITYH